MWNRLCEIHSDRIANSNMKTTATIARDKRGIANFKTLNREGRKHGQTIMVIRERWTKRGMSVHRKGSVWDPHCMLWMRLMLMLFCEMLSRRALNKIGRRRKLCITDIC